MQQSTHRRQLQCGMRAGVPAGPAEQAHGGQRLRGDGAAAHARHRQAGWQGAPVSMNTGASVGRLHWNLSKLVALNTW